MSDDQIETLVCRMYDDVDARFLASNSMTAAEYTKLCRAIDQWAEDQYARRYPQWRRA